MCIKGKERRHIYIQNSWARQYIYSAGWAADSGCGLRVVFGLSGPLNGDSYVYMYMFGAVGRIVVLYLGDDDDDGKDAMLATVAMVAMLAGIKIYSGKSQQPRRSPLMHVHLLLTHKHMLKVDEGKKKWLRV